MKYCQMKTSQQTYLRENEQRALDSLIYQFNDIMSRMPANRPEYIVHLILERTAGFYRTSNIREKFIAHCESAGWHVKSVVINECQFIVKVSPRVLHINA
jgi:uncharacterized protein CbrC (UPF0167 family)